MPAEAADDDIAIRSRYFESVTINLSDTHSSTTTNTMPHGRITNFGAGPSALPVEVLEEAAQGLLNFEGTGIGIAEISRRSKEFTAYLAGDSGARAVWG